MAQATEALEELKTLVERKGGLGETDLARVIAPDHGGLGHAATRADLRPFECQTNQAADRWSRPICAGDP